MLILRALVGMQHVSSGSNASHFPGGRTVKSHVGSVQSGSGSLGRIWRLTCVGLCMHGGRAKPCKGRRSRQLNHEIESPEKFAEGIVFYFCSHASRKAQWTGHLWCCHAEIRASIIVGPSDSLGAAVKNRVSFVDTAPGRPSQRR